MGIGRFKMSGSRSVVRCDGDISSAKQAPAGRKVLRGESHGRLFSEAFNPRTRYTMCDGSADIKSALGLCSLATIIVGVK